MIFQWLKSDKTTTKFILATLSAILLAIPWTWGGSFTLFFALVPLLFIEQSSSRKSFFFYSSYAIILWHILAVFWITKAAAIGLFAATALNLVLWNIALQLFSYSRRNNKKSLSYIILVSGIIAMEHLNLFNVEITWPWLVLGNGFANTHTLVQWYEYTGALGGSLWAIVVNIIIYEFLVTQKRKFLYSAIGIVLVGVVVSKIIYHTYLLEEEKIKVAIIQPNFDPYDMKFEMGRDMQVKIVDSMIRTLPSDLDYIIMPETTFDETLPEKYIDNYQTIRQLKKTMLEIAPNADMIMGSTTSIFYYEDIAPSPTARKYGQNEYYDISNSSLSINPSRETEVYKKSKLVIGVEMLPFNSIISKIGDLSIKLGGASGTLLPQSSAENFTHTSKGIVAGGVICYEGIYGEYYSQFILKDAEVMFIITNDGWWDDTYGYKQLFTYSQLRAIETRREIARSANTGISGFINARGDTLQTLGWWKRGILIGEITLNNNKTFYTMQGDYIGAISWYVLVLMILYSISLRFKKKMLMN